MTLNVTNEVPETIEDAYLVQHDTPISASADVGVLFNDTDGDGDSLTASLVSGPVNGVLTLSADGSFSYTPNAGFVGDDQFTYTAVDAHANSVPTNVSIRVENQPPVAVADKFNGWHDTVLTIDQAEGLLANDRGQTGETLVSQLVSGLRCRRVRLIVLVDGGRKGGYFAFRPGEVEQAINDRLAAPVERK